MTRLDKIADSLMRPINPSLILILGTYTIIWGLWLIAPWWSVFAHGMLYSQMAQLAPESVWGLGAVLSGLVTLRGAFKPSYMNLHTGSFVASVFWFVIAILYFVADWHSTGWITALCFFAYAAVVFINVKINKHVYDNSHS